MQFYISPRLRKFLIVVFLGLVTAQCYIAIHLKLSENKYYQTKLRKNSYNIL